MNLSINIICSDDMIQSFCKKNNIEYEESLENIFIKFFSNYKFPEQVTLSKNTYTNVKSYIGIQFLKIGDYVSIHYSPYSQKYIDHYNQANFSGFVFYINETLDNMLIYYCVLKNNKQTIVIKSLEIENTSYFGNTNDYTYFIYH